MTSLSLTLEVRGVTICLCVRTWAIPVCRHHCVCLRVGTWAFGGLRSGHVARHACTLVQLIVCLIDSSEDVLDQTDLLNRT
jgi:hypothetical protein